MKLLRAGAPVKRIVILIDGTWDKEGTTGNTNVAKLDVNALIKRRAANGTVQRVRYHDGVGAYGDIFKKVLGGAIGLGLKKIVLDCYGFLVDDYEAGDEIYILGFSRGAYAARALAGLIGASGIARRPSADSFEIAWQHYRVSPASRQQPRSANWADRSTIAKYRSTAQGKTFHDTRSIKCVGVWDTVGSLGIPVYFADGRYDLYRFKDTALSPKVERGFHAMAIDELRADFPVTRWEDRLGVRQVWFAGAHSDVGGGYVPDQCGLSDVALDWMMRQLNGVGVLFETPARLLPNLERKNQDIHEPWKKIPFNALLRDRREVRATDYLHESVLKRWQRDAAYRPSAMQAFTKSGLDAFRHES